ncbi:MAG TPA: hypothetical protein VN853_23685, partial [Polyangia bacterium]|nr:hypothetical protein [Polyangia bacterium]
IAGEAKLALGDAPGAVGALRASLATNPFDPRVHCALATAYEKLSGTDRPGADAVARERGLCKDLAGE